MLFEERKKSCSLIAISCGRAPRQVASRRIRRSVGARIPLPCLPLDKASTSGRVQQDRPLISASPRITVVFLQSCDSWLLSCEHRCLISTCGGSIAFAPAVASDSDRDFLTLTSPQLRLWRLILVGPWCWHLRLVPEEEKRSPVWLAGGNVVRKEEEWYMPPGVGFWWPAPGVEQTRVVTKHPGSLLAMFRQG